MQIFSILKKIPIDFGQGNLRHTTKGKQIALELVGKGDTTKTVLDVGCRDGHFSKRLESSGFITTSIDIECAYERCQRVDANRPLPFPDQTFDRIWCSEVIEHLNDPAAVIHEFRRVLKPGGFAVFTTPNSTIWLYAILRLFGKRPKDTQNPGHIHFFGTKDIIALGPRDNVLYGYFPYLFLKFRIRHLVGLLSPTFIFVIKK